MNEVRAAKKELMEVNKIKPAPLSGVQLLEIMFKVGFLADKKKSISLMREAAGLAKEGFFRPDNTSPDNRKRILLTGVPVGMGSDKVVRIVEQSGADVVALENCSGYKEAFSVDEQADPMDALAAQYLSTPCSVMSPNQGRLSLLKEMIREFQADGVIDLTWQACHTYNVEAFTIAEFVRHNFGIPTLHLETDYAEGDSEQLRVRIEAYLEIV